MPDSETGSCSEAGREEMAADTHPLSGAGLVSNEAWAANSIFAAGAVLPGLPASALLRGSCCEVHADIALHVESWKKLVPADLLQA